MADITVKNVAKDRYHALSISQVWIAEKVRSASAIVIGVGALGNEVCKNLTMMGVRRIYVLDRDRVERANLTRSVFFREHDDGRYKTEVVAERLRDLNPDVEVHTLTGDLNDCLGLGLLSEMDLVFGCLDSREARRSLNRMCHKVGKPWVDGAMEDLVGKVSVFVPDEGVCYECGLSPIEVAMISRRASCAEIAETHVSGGRIPTTSTMGSIIAAIQVQEALKLHHGLPSRSHSGTGIKLDCVSNEFYVTRLEPKEDCPGHITFGEVTRLPDITNLTTAGDLLMRFHEQTGEHGRIDLGRDEVVVALQCPTCEEVTWLPSALRTLHTHELPCPNTRCNGKARAPLTTHSVMDSSPFVDWPLWRLGIPDRDILEVQGSSQTSWYELAPVNTSIIGTFSVVTADRSNERSVAHVPTLVVLDPTVTP